MNPIFTLSIIGVGSRGCDAYGSMLVASFKDEFKVVALCDIVPEKISRFEKVTGTTGYQAFYTEDEFLKEKRSDVLLIATPDNDHVRIAMKAMKIGYRYILMEKPISASKEECLELLKLQKETNTNMLVCHVLRYAPAYLKLKEVIDSGTLGKVIAIDHMERVAYWHIAHSYVRGNWRNLDIAAPLIMAKCCHDFDLLQWFASSKAKSISSYGDLMLFKKENKPEGAASRCIDCPLKECPYSAVKKYIEEWESLGSDPHGWWPFNVVCTDYPVTKEKLLKAIKEGPYGRCVYECDNNVCDHQIANILFENNVKVTFRVIGETPYPGRRIEVFGTMGSVLLDEGIGKLIISPFGKEEIEYKIADLVKEDSFGHGGGDFGILKALYQMCLGNKGDTSLENSLESHFMCFAAEESRLAEGKTVLVHKD